MIFDAWINGERFRNFEDFEREFRNLIENDFEYKKKEAPKLKKIGDYTLNEVKSFCPYTSDAVNDGAERCNSCKFNCVCALTPEKWEKAKLDNIDKPRLTNSERENIEKQIEELKRKLENG